MAGAAATKQSRKQSRKQSPLRGGAIGSGDRDRIGSGRIVRCSLLLNEGCRDRPGKGQSANTLFRVWSQSDAAIALVSYRPIPILATPIRGSHTDHTRITHGGGITDIAQAPFSVFSTVSYPIYFSLSQFTIGTNQ